MIIICVILQVPLVDKSLAVNLYKVNNLPILHPILQNTFWYSIEGYYLTLSCGSNYATLSSEWDMLTCVFNRGHMFKFDTALYPTEKVPWCLYTLLVNDAERFTMKCNCEVKPQTHNVSYNLNRNLWASSALHTKKLQILIITLCNLWM